MAKLTVEIVTPEKRIVSVQADEVIVPGAEGLFGVRPGHTPFLTVMEPGELTIKSETTVQRYFVAEGFAEVDRDRVVVLADQAEPVTAINVDVARRKLSEAQERLRTLAASDLQQFRIEQATVKRETVRMHLGSGR
jgi:F-type H+-transporting ATPase subunit epsilon